MEEENGLKAKPEEMMVNHESENTVGETEFQDIIAETKQELIQNCYHLRGLSENHPEVLGLIHFPHNFLSIKAYEKVRASGRMVSKDLEKQIQPLIEEYQSLLESQKTKKEIGEKENDEFWLRRKELSEKMKLAKKAVNFLFRVLGEEEKDPGLTQVRAAIIAQDLKALQDTSFAYFSEAYINGILINLLNPERLNQLYEIKSVQSAREFIRSQPLSGMKIAEIGGGATTILEKLGAEVDNRDTLEKKGLDEEQKNILHKINLDNWERVYKAGNYDLVCSHMVMDAGSGIEEMRPEYKLELDTGSAVMELHQVCNKMMKIGAISVHVGDAALDRSLSVISDYEQYQKYIDLLGDGSIENLKKIVYRDSFGWGHTAGGYLADLLPGRIGLSYLSSNKEAYEIEAGISLITSVSWGEEGLGLAGGLNVFRKKSEFKTK